MIPNRWYLPFFLPSTALMIAIALALLVAWVALRRASRGHGPIRNTPPTGSAGTAAITALLPGGGPWRITGRIALAGASVCAALLWIASMPLTAAWMLRITEAPYVPIDPATLPVADAIVVPSGAIVATRGPDGYIHTRLGAANDRHETALRAYFAGRAPILALGNGRPAFPGAPTEAEFTRDRAIERGVPANAIIAGPESSFTSDEASNLAPLLHTRGVRHIILCTSAHHMARAIPHYEVAGFKVTALPCHFMTYGTPASWNPMQLVPSAIALEAVDTCVKNWLGRAVGPRVQDPRD